MEEMEKVLDYLWQNRIYHEQNRETETEFGYQKREDRLVRYDVRVFDLKISYRPNLYVGEKDLLEVVFDDVDADTRMLSAEETIGLIKKRNKEIEEATEYIIEKIKGDKND